MTLSVLFDKEVKDDSFSGGWGLSYLMGEDLLFDTGEKFDYLAHNAEKMHLDLASFKKIVITHDHWDHTGGLWGLLKLNPQRIVYACSGFSREFKDRVKSAGAVLIEVKEKEEIVPGIYSTGEIKTEYKGEPLSEQALVLDKGDHCLLFSGCAHPGIVMMAEKVKNDFAKPVTAVLGGFHLLDKEKRYVEYVITQLRDMGVTRVAAVHCTGFDAQVLFKQAWKKDFISLKTGMTLEV